LIFAGLFVISSAFHAAETSITTLYPWKVKEFAKVGREGGREGGAVCNFFGVSRGGDEYRHALSLEGQGVRQGRLTGAATAAAAVAVAAAVNRGGRGG
jgi:hypothetical protein